MQIIEGLTIFHVIAAVLGITLFVVALGLLIRSGIKFNTYPLPLLSCLVIGGALAVFPVTGKFEAGAILSEIPKLTEKLKDNPGDTQARKSLDANVKRIEKSVYVSPATRRDLDKARKALNP